MLTLQVADLDAEMRRLRDGQANIRVEAAATARLSGSTRSVYVEDPDGNVVELLEHSPERGWDYTACAVAGARATFLHLQLNTYDFEMMSRFYAGFGSAPDPLSEGRPNVDYRKLIDMSRSNPYVEAFGRPLNNKVTNGVALFQLPGDHSEMHLEIMGWNAENLVVPGSESTFHQLGIMRYCFKTVDHLERLAELKRRGRASSSRTSSGPTMRVIPSGSTLRIPTATSCVSKSGSQPGIGEREGVMARPIIEAPVKPHFRTTRSF